MWYKNFYKHYQDFRCRCQIREFPAAPLVPRVPRLGRGKTCWSPEVVSPLQTFLTPGGDEG